MKNEKNAMFLDKLQVEKERGITVKAQTCSMFHKFVDEETGETKEILLNLIDTPVRPSPASTTLLCQI